MAEEENYQNKLGELKIFFGMSAGVGKTHAMLEEAHERLKEGVDVVIGVVITHGQQEIEQLVTGIPIIPEKLLKYRDTIFKEMDLEALLQRKPDLVLVDELAHINTPGSKHTKRWQDVIELLDAGIDVYTTLNVQHIESYKDIVENIVDVQIEETVPDIFLERAATIELIDIAPTGLLKRMSEGKVYLGGESQIGRRNFFKEEILTALREIALRYTADKVDHDLHAIHSPSQGWEAREKFMVAISPNPDSQKLIRITRRRAFELDIPWIAIYADIGILLSDEERNRLLDHMNLARELGGEVIITQDLDIASAIHRVAEKKNITRLILGRSPEENFFSRIFHDTLFDKIERENKNLDLYILRQEEKPDNKTAASPKSSSHSPSKDYLFAIGCIALVTAFCYFLMLMSGYGAIGYIYLANIVFLSTRVGLGPIILSILFSTSIWMVLFYPESSAGSASTISHLILGWVFFSISSAIGLTTNRLWNRNRLNALREKNLERLSAIQRAISHAPRFEDLRVNVCDKLQTIFGGQFDVLIKGSDGKLVFDSRLKQIEDDKEKTAIQWVFENGKPAGWSTQMFTSSEGLFLPLQFSQSPSGVLVYYPGQKAALLSIEELNLLQTAAEEIGAYRKGSLT